MARTWKCPECGHTEAIRYDWLAEHGGPVCEHCDCDMEVQPETDATNESIADHANPTEEE
jgi:transposase-like protein